MIKWMNISMKLMYYEYYKLMKSKKLLLLLLGLLAMNLVLLYQSESKTKNYDMYVKNKGVYTEFSTRYHSMPIEQKKAEWSEILAFNKVQWILLGIHSSDMDSELLQELYKECPNYNELSIKYQWLSKNLNRYAYYAKEFLKQESYKEEFSEFIDDMEQRETTIQSFAIFNQVSKFTKQSTLKTSNDYRALENVMIQSDNNTAIESISNYRIPDLGLVTIIVFLCISLFVIERENGVLLLMKTQPRGHTNAILAKFLVLFSIIIGGCFLFYLIPLFALNHWYGLGDLSRSIQSLPMYRNCIFPITVLEFLVLAILLKCFLYVIFGAIISCIFIFIRNSLKCFSFVLLFIAAQYLLYVILPLNSSWNYFKCLNFFYCLNTKELIGNYINLNLFHHPVNVFYVVLVLGSIIGVVMMVCSVMIFNSYYSFKSENILATVMNRIEYMFKTIFAHTSLFWHEIYRQYIHHKVGVLLVVLLGICILDCSKNQTQMFFSVEEASYQSYISILEGKITSKTKTYIESEREYYNNLEEKIKQLAEDPSSNNNASIIMSISFEIQNRKGGFELIEQQYTTLIERNKEKDAVYLVNENAYHSLLENRYLDYKVMAMNAFLLIIIQSILFCGDHKNNAIKVIRTTRNGRSKLYYYKLGISLVSTSIVFICCYLPRYFNFIKGYGASSMDAPLNNLTRYIEVQSGITIGQTLFALLVTKFVFSIIVTITIVYLSIKIRNYMVTLLASTVILFFPSLFLYFKTPVSFHNVLNSTYDIMLVFIALNVLMVLVGHFIQVRMKYHFTNN